MKKKLFLGAILTTTAILGVLMANLVIGDSNVQMHFANADLVTKKLSLQYTTISNTLTDKNGHTLNTDASYTPQEFELDTYTTIKTVYATYKDDSFVRLNKPASADNPSYFEKEEASNGFVSFTIRLYNGSVDVLVGYEKDEWAYCYTVTKPNSGNKDVTINAKGNYFRVINKNTETDALVRKFELNYQCTKESKSVESEYTIVNGNNATVHSNPNKWYFNQNGSTRVSESTYADREFTSTIATLASGDGVQYRYDVDSLSGLVATFNVTFDVKLSQSARIRRGSDYDVLEAETWTTFTSKNRSAVTATDTTIFSVVLNEDAEGSLSNVVVVVRNIIINRTISFDESSL